MPESNVKTGAVSTPLPSDLVSVGHITGAYGVQGWVRVHPYSSDADALLFAKTWWLGKTKSLIDRANLEAPLEQLRDVEKLEAKIHGEDVVARFMGIVGREAAENLKGHVIQIQRSHFPALSDNEFYWLDLIGLNVVNLQSESIGVVMDLIDNGAHPILKVVRANTDTTGADVETLIPFVEQFVPSVDQKNKIITVDWGLDY